MRVTLSFILFLIYLSAWSQPDPSIANDFFKKTNYIYAIPEYKNLLKLERDNGDYNYKLGVCYIRTNIDKALAVTYLERALKAPKHPTDTELQLGIAYTFIYEFDKAIEQFSNYRKKATPKEQNEIDQFIENCQIAKQMMRNPIPIVFTNLGPAINTDAPDYYPFTTGDEKVIYYTTRRKDGKSTKVEYDGYFASEIYTFSFNGESFSPGKNFVAINSTYDDQVVGLAADGEHFFLFSTGQEEKGALYKVYKKGSVYKKEIFIEEVNQEKSIETSGFMSPDGTIIFFASNRSGGYGGYDIWMIRQLPNGKWGVPYNLGPEINTPKDEDFPSLSADGLTLYFSSNGHAGMGGYDLFQSTWDPESGIFTMPKNMGYPLNTPFDERTISYTADGKHAYISALRKDGLGDLDIYRVTFEDVEYLQTLFQIVVPVPGNSTQMLKDIVITITNEKGESIGDYRPNQQSGRFTIILGPGKYNLNIDAEGYKAYTEIIKVNEFTHRMGKIEKIINLTK